MAIIRSDNPEIEKALVRLEDLVSEGGGGIHSDLVIHCRDGALSLETRERMRPGREIIRLARENLLPSDQYEVEVRGGTFTARFETKSSFTTLQQKLADTMMELYTLTNKAALHRQYSFLLSLSGYPDLLDMVAAGRNMPREMAKWKDRIRNGLSGDDMDEFVAKTFLKTRYLGYQDNVRTFSVSVLMPVIDFLNHHWYGASFAGGMSVRQGDLAVACAQPVESSLECYAYYGIMDPFDALLRYDFIDESSPLMRSVPLVLDAGDAGTIRVDSSLGAVNREPLHKSIADLGRFMPVVVQDAAAKQVTASHLMIPVNGSPLALRRILAHLLARLSGRGDDLPYILSWVTEAERQVVEANRAYYERLRDAVRAHQAAKPADAGLERLLYLADLQLGRLAGYKFFAPAQETQAQAAG